MWSSCHSGAHLASRLHKGVCHVRRQQRPAPFRLAFVNKAKSGSDVWRPSHSDVESISRGDAAKRRGTGSREVPHRLNADERKAYDLAKDKKFLTVKGTGYRKERKGSPLANIFRQWCDASQLPCIVVEQGFGNDPLDSLVLDFVTLRDPDTEQFRAPCNALAARMGAIEAEDISSLIPFTILVQSPHVEEPEVEASLSPDRRRNMFHLTFLAIADTAWAMLDSAQKAAPAQDLPRFPYIPPEAFQELPVWALPPQALAFKCQRSTAKQLAAALLETITSLDEG